MTTDLDPGYLEAATVTAERPFSAWALDELGFIYTDEDVRAWCENPEEANNNLGLEQDGFDRIVVVTGSAAEARAAGVRMRAPGSHVVRDRWIEYDIFGCEADEVLALWKQAHTVARLLNKAVADGDQIHD